MTTAIKRWTHKELAERFGVSRGRIYQLEQRALQKIRKAVLADRELRQLASEVCGFDGDQAEDED